MGPFEHPFAFRREPMPIKFGGARISDYLLSPSSAVKAKVIMSDLAPGGGGGEALYSLNCEEEFVFVLKGRLVVKVDDEETDLDEGDAMTFDPRRPHTFRNASESLPAQALFMASKAESPESSRCARCSSLITSS